jgi:hypothetical protein
MSCLSLNMLSMVKPSTRGPHFMQSFRDQNKLRIRQVSPSGSMLDLREVSNIREMI